MLTLNRTRLQETVLTRENMGPRRGGQDVLQNKLVGMGLLHWEEWEHQRHMSSHLFLKVTIPSMDKHLGFFL